MEPAQSKLLLAVLAYLKDGNSVIPVRSDKTPAVSSWKQWQKELPPAELVQRWFENGGAIAVICGAVSRHRVAIDFDRPGLCDEFEQLLKDHGYAELVASLTRVRTPSGGHHLYLRSQGPVGGNRKLAETVGPDGRPVTLIETRGEGGYTLVPPSPDYVIERGRPDRVVVVDEETLTLLFDFAAVFDEIVHEEVVNRDRPGERGQDGAKSGRVGDDYNARADLCALLASHGWTLTGYRGDKGLWRRPGKAKGLSATSNYNGCGLFYVFSTNAAPFEPGRAYDAFGIFARLECGGDFAAAAKRLASMGFGAPMPEKDVIDIADLIMEGEHEESADPPDEEVSDPPGDETPEQEKNERHGTVSRDFRQAAVFSSEHKSKFRFLNTDQWYRYKDDFWSPVNSKVVERRVQEWLYLRYQAGEEVEVKGARVREILYHSTLLLGVHDANAFNTHTNWVPMGNGVFDTDSEELIAHDPSHLFTYKIPYDFDPEAECPLWLKCLGEWMVEEDGTTCQEWIDILQMWYGYCLIADNTAQTCMFWLGEGGNGKGVATRVLEQLVGPAVCCAVPIETLDREYDRAMLYGKLVGFVNEPSRTAMVKNSSWFKYLTGGEDKMPARFPYGQPFQYHNTARIILTCNDLPPSNDPSRAYFRRIIPIQWRYNVPADRQDTQLDRKLRAELPGIFNWALEGLRRYRASEDRFALPAPSRKLLEGYRRDTDVLGRFLSERVVFDAREEQWEEHRLTAADVYSAYEEWCRQNGEKPVTANMLGRRLTANGAVRFKFRLPADGTMVAAWKYLQMPGKESMPIDEGSVDEEE